MHTVKRIFRYLKGQPTLGLWYPKDSPLELIAYSDSDYACASLDRKSTTGGCQFLGSRLISGQCKKQTIVVNSTTEVRYVDASNCCGHVLWIQNQMLDYGYNFMNTKIFIDNKSTICIVKNPVFHLKTKHIEIRHHFIRDSNEKKLIQMIKIHIDQNVADLLTKSFDVGRFQYLTESSIRRIMRLDDAEGTSCLTNTEIFEGLARMGYEKPSDKLTFYKAFFFPQWKFLIHTILQCLSAKTTSWNEFSSTMASAIICLATNQKFNFSRCVLLSLVKNIEAGIPFFMFPRFVQLIINHQLGDLTYHKDIFTTPSLTKKNFANMKRVGTGFSGEVTLLFDNMLKKHKPKRKYTKEHKFPPTKSQAEHNVPLPLPSHDPLPSGEDSLKLKELMDLCTNLSNKVLDLESDVLDINSTYKAKIEKLESMVERLEEENRVLKELKCVHFIVDSNEPVMEKEESSKQKRKIADIDDDEINLEKVQAEAYHLDLDHQEKVLSVLDVNDEEPASVEEVLEVVKDAKLITEVVTTAGVDVNAASVQDSPITAAKATKVIVEVPKPRKRRDEEVARQLEVELNANINWNAVIEQVKRSERLTDENMAVYKVNYFKGMSYYEIRPLFEKHYNYSQAFLNEVNEGIKVPKKEVRQEKEVEVESSKTKVSTPLASEIPIIDYKIHTERNRPYFKIIRVDGNQRLEVDDESEMYLKLLRLVRRQLNEGIMASAIICLTNNQKFNFSKYILDNLKKNLEAGVPFYMFLRKHKPRRKKKKERKAPEVSPIKLTIEYPIPITSNDPLPSGEDSIQLNKLMILCTNLSNKVLDLEVRRAKQEKSSKQERKIADIDADAEVNLENVYNLDMAHEEIVLISVAPINITTAQPSEVTKTTVDISTAPKAKGIVFHDIEESTIRTASLKVHVKDKGKSKQSDVLRKCQALKRKHVSVAQERKNMMIYLKNMAGFKMKFYKGMSYEEIRPLFEEEYNKVQTLFKEGLKIDAERIKALRKRTRKKNVEKDQTAKKQKGVKKLKNTHDPLALVAYTSSSSRSPPTYHVIHPPSVVDYDDEYQGDTFQNDLEDPLTSIMMVLARGIT
nr:putative ribonuclease H-like domain-containing protein [Tanacetum cinerariifolium]